MATWVTVRFSADDLRLIDIIRRSPSMQVPYVARGRRGVVRPMSRARMVRAAVRTYTRMYVEAAKS